MSTAKPKRKGKLPDQRDLVHPRPRLPQEDASRAQSDDLAPFVTSLIGADREACWRLADRRLETDRDVLSLYQELFQPALYRIGELWATNRISVATEHVATAITEQMMNRVYPRVIASRRCGRKAVVGVVEGELHQVGAKMVADVFELHGWDAVFAGAGCSTDDLLRMVDAERPDVLALSCSIFEHFDILERMLERIREEQPLLPVVLGGQGFQGAGAELALRIPHVSCPSTLKALSKLIVAFDDIRIPEDDA